MGYHDYTGPPILEDFMKAAESSAADMRTWSELTPPYKYKLKLGNLRMKVYSTGRYTPYDYNGPRWIYPSGKIESINWNNDTLTIVDATIACNDEKIHPILVWMPDQVESVLIPYDVTASEESLLLKEAQSITSWDND